MNDTLYIIGNGFDLHHGLNTSYSSFRDNCAKKSTILWGVLTEIYGDSVNEDMWWSDFEEMLAKIHYLNLVHTHNGDAMGAMKVQKLLNGTIPPFFGGWIRDLNHKTQIDESLNINPRSLFFTFNYTLTLENVYHVKAENVWHIHGSIKDVDNIVVGHDSDERKLFVEYIAYKDESLVFVEVKSLPNGSPELLQTELNRGKLQRIVKTSKRFLLKHRQYSNSYVRYDVIVIDMPGYPQAYHIENAFTELL